MATRKILFRGQTRHKGEKTSISGKPLPGIWVTGGIFPQNKGYERAIIYTQDPNEQEVTCTYTKCLALAKDIDTLQLCYGPRFNALKVDSLWNKAFELMDDVTRSEIIEDLKFFQKALRGYEEKPVKDAQKILDGISELFGEEVASK